VTVGIFSAAAYAALKEVAETMPVETIRGFLAKVASAYLIEIERRKSITEYAVCDALPFQALATVAEKVYDFFGEDVWL